MLLFDLDQTTVNSLPSVEICDAAARNGLDWLDTWREVRNDWAIVSQDQPMPLWDVMLRMFYQAPKHVASCTARELSYFDTQRLKDMGCPDHMVIYDRALCTMLGIGGRDWTKGGSDPEFKTEVAHWLIVKGHASSVVLVDDRHDTIEEMTARGFGAIHVDQFQGFASALASTFNGPEIAEAVTAGKNDLAQIWTIGRLIQRGLV